MVPTFFITGATGEQGGATVRELLKHGSSVHALVRDNTSPSAVALSHAGATLFQGDFNDTTTIKSAMIGVTGVFLNPFLSHTPGEELRQAQNIINIAVAAKTVTTLVVSTAFLTSKHQEWAAKTPNYPLYNYYSSKFSIEAAVRAANFQHYTILRPAWLMHNYLPPTCQYHFPELIPEHVLAGAYQPETTMAHFAAGDVGKFAAAALLEPERFSGHEIELGNEALTLKEAADVLSTAAGIQIIARYRDQEDIEAMKEKVPTMGFQIWANTNDMTVDAVKLKQYGIPLVTFQEFLKGEVKLRDMWI